MILEFIESVKDEKKGFSFDEPWRLEEKALGVIIPILRKSQKKRTYVTFAESKDVNVQDTGQIDYIFVTNNGKKSVLVSRADILKGKTQERAVIHDHIINPGAGARIAVRCIHQARPITGRADMGYGGKTPYDIGFSSQHRTWESTSSYMRSAAMASSASSMRGPTVFQHSSDLSATLEDLSKNIQEVMRKIPFIENQVGAAFFEANKMLGMDVYDLSASWDAVKKDVVEKEGAAFLKKEDQAAMFDFKPEAGKVLLKDLLSARFDERDIYNAEYRLVELKSDKLIGEAIEFKGEVIHLTFWARP